jgi:RNA polymerase sigma-70 factor (ECF subfamily)
MMVMTKKEDKHQARRYRIFEEELLPHLEALSTFAYHLTYNDTDADDLVQETYLKAFRFIDKYIEGTNAKAWLFKILKNVFINDFRRKSKSPAVEELPHTPDKIETHSSFPSQEVFDKTMGDEVTNAINSMSVDFRVAILLCDVEGFTYEEISKILNVPIGTVRSRLHRGRKELKEKLREYAKSRGFNDQIS